MIASTAPSSSTPDRIAITVVDMGTVFALSPFFGKCGGALLIDGKAGTRKFYSNPSRSSEAMCKLILRLHPEVLICGFIAKAERLHLQEAGIDVRIGSCACLIDKLTTILYMLPAA